MEQIGESEQRKDKQKVGNGADFDILHKDVSFWQRAVASLAKEQITETVDEISENDNKSVTPHAEKVFAVNCRCSKCLTYRKLIIGIHLEIEAYNDLWNKLKEIFNSYYTLLPVEQSSVIRRKYDEMQTNSCGVRWFSDGSIDVKKNIHASMGSHFSLSNEMTFIIVFNSLILRDKFQLFQLLSLQLTTIIIAYREGIKEMTKVVENEEEFFKPEEFLTYILDGYKNISSIADTLTPLVIEMRDHLEKFSLNWKLMNQCMYYRFLYVDIENQMADCILRLKDRVDAETYKSFVYKFIKFDEEMTQVGQVWEVALVALELYRKSTPEQVARSERVEQVRQIIESLHHLKDIETDSMLNDKALGLDWIVSSEKDDVWLNVLNLIKQKDEPPYKDNKKHPCFCWVCLMADGDKVPEICAIPDDSPSHASKSKNCYHLAWAVFKHLKDREPYKKPIVHPDAFCVFKDPPCKLMQCQVGMNLIVGAYPMSFTKFLIRTYQPLTIADREKFLKVPSQSLIRKFCLKKGGAAAKEIMQEADEINHSFLLLNMFWDDDEIADPMLRAGLAAALAENFKTEIKFPQKHIIFSYFYALFRPAGPSNDIIMDLEWLHKVIEANLFKNFGVISNSIQEPTMNNASNTVEAIEMTLNELKINAEVSSGSSNALDLVQFSMKEVADKLSSISLTDENNEDAKKVLENEIKKPLVEALKLAASNKKLEAELKSLQKEHNMLKDMVKGLEQIHGDKKEVQVTVTTASKSVLTERNMKCGHNHHSHSGSSSPSTSEAEVGRDSGNGSECVCYYCTLFGKNQDLNPRQTETRDRLRKKLHGSHSQKEFCCDKTKNSKCCKGGKHHCSSNGFDCQHRNKKASKSNSKKVKAQREPDLNMRSVEHLIEYIEGPSSKAVVEQKKAREAAAKKQQKKAKQLELKIRRQIDLFLEELNALNVNLHAVVTEAKQVQNQLSQLKAGKGKNKELKKVKTAELKLAELSGQRVRKESEAKRILNSIKELNRSVDLFSECNDMKTILPLLGPPPFHYQPRPHSFRIQPPVQASRSVAVQESVKVSEDDPAKRMVTIRRINLPHAEPQVTVTAKGTTPDMDQLLYTFVNGQLVPASSLSPSAFQNGSIQLFMSSNGQTKMVVGNDLQQKSVKNMVQITPVIHLPTSMNNNSKKKQAPTQPAAPEKSKRELKKKKEEPTPSDKKTEKKTKKAYIDPEFAANPFKLLDEEQRSESEEETSDDCNETNTPVKKEDDDLKNVKKTKDEKKTSNKQTAVSLQGKKSQTTAKAKIERKDSVTSVTSSNASKDSKSSKKLKNVANRIAFQAPEPLKSTIASMPSHPMPINSSLMDQLNRGIRVEGLRLPPGITLTKVPQSEVHNSKRESINRIAQPMQDYSTAPVQMTQLVTQGDPNGIIMVESNPHAETGVGKKKNKKKKAKTDGTENAQRETNSNQADRIVTLKNPMFFNNNNPSEPINSMMRNIQTPPFVSPMAPEPTSASIVRNENGMYTIRNPSFQNAFGGGASPSPAYVPRPTAPTETIVRPFAPPSYGAFAAEQTPSVEVSHPKCSSVIGSEMKNVLQRRKEQEFAANMDSYNQYGIRTPAAYSHFGGSGVNFNNNGTNCDESFLSQQAASGFQPYQSPTMPNYDDLRLTPGQMLNSEVTIHNVTESKIFQNQAKKTPPPIGTPRNGNVETVGAMFGDLMIRAVPPSEIINGKDKANFMTTPSQKLNDIEADRENDTFKRFDFNHVPPKQPMKIINEPKKIGMSHAMVDEFDRKQNSTNSNSPISVTSLDEIYESGDQKMASLNQKPSFYSSNHNFSEDKSSGASSLFSSGL